MPIDTTHSSLSAALPLWKRCRDVLAGSDAVKQATVAYLPRLASQCDLDYQCYLQRANFFNGTARTRAALVGSVFGKDPVTKLPDAVRARTAGLLEDIDEAGTTFNDFAVRVLEDVIGVGRCGVLVEMPSTAVPSEKRRPYCVRYEAEQIVNWRTAAIGGDPSVLSLVVLKETAEQVSETDRFVVKTVERYRVLELIPVEGAAPVYTVSVFQRGTNGNFAPIDDPIIPTRRGAPLNFIPFVFVGPSSIQPCIEKPPLLDMVDVNLSHYRSSADLEHARHFAGLPTFWVRGAKAQGDLPIGPTAVWKLEGDHATAGVLEISGNCLPELRAALEQKAEQMAVLGARLIEQATAKAETAESVKARNAAVYASLRTMAGTVSLAMTNALRWLVWWAGIDNVAPADIAVELNREFIEHSVGADELKSLTLAYQAGSISFETLYFNLTRGGRTRPGVTADEERARIGEAA